MCSILIKCERLLRPPNRRLHCSNGVFRCLAITHLHTFPTHLTSTSPLTSQKRASSRQDHAHRRQRGPHGRFLSASELAAASEGIMAQVPESLGGSVVVAEVSPPRSPSRDGREQPSVKDAIVLSHQ